MGRKALTILLLFSLCSEFFSFASDDGQGPNPVYKRGSTALELALPPSPEAASRVKYADVPFSHSMGLAEYEVAFSPLKGCELTVPVSLRYRSGGIKLQEVAGVAGLGWTLEAGGCITRTVMDMPDEFVSELEFMTHQMPSASDTVSLSYLSNLAWHRKEAQLDRYSYNVCGLSGTFVIQDNDELTLLSGDAVHITFVRDSGGAPYYFTIVGPDGTIYRFNEREYTHHDGTNGDDSSLIIHGEEDKWYAVTTWHLSYIKSRSGLETANFSYAVADSMKRHVWSTSYGVTDIRHSNQSDSLVTSLNQRVLIQTYHPKVLSKITLGDFDITFTYAGGTGQIIRSGSSLNQVDNFPRRLTGIALHHETEGQLDSLAVGTGRDIHDGRILLLGLNRYRQGVYDDKWTFSYDTRGHTVSKASEDWYGYYNAQGDQDGNEVTIAPFDLSGSPTQIANIKRGYPSPGQATYLSMLSANHDGEITTFEYAGNTFTDINSQQVTIGLHVKSIAIATPDGVQQYRNFSYSGGAADGDTYPILSMYTTLSAPWVQTIFYPSTLHVDDIYTWPFAIHETPVTMGASLRDTRVFWGTVSEERSDESWLYLQRPNRTKTTRIYSMEGISGFSEETISHFPSGVAQDYNTYGPSFIGPFTGIRYKYTDKSSACPPRLIRQEEYAYSDSQYTLLSSVDYTYQKTEYQDVLVQYSSSQVWSYTNKARINITDIYHYPVYAQQAPDWNATSALRVSYHPHGNDSTLVSMDYVPRSSLEMPVRLSSVSSTDGGIERSLDYTYPDTWLDSTPTWRDTLVQQHCIASPVKTEFTVREAGSQTPATPLRTEVIQYGMFQVQKLLHTYNVLYPRRHIEYYLGAECWSEAFLSRDGHGNVTSVKEKGKPLTAIAWDPSGLYPTSITQDTLVSRYTFRPGVGLTSSADPSGVKTLYDYDHVGRLTAVKDSLNRQLESWEYHLFYNTGANGLPHRFHRKYRTANGSSYGEDATWWNTLGVHLQDIVAGGSGDGRDLVTAYGSDYLLHDDARVWLPYPVANSGLAFQSGAEQAAATYHDNALAYQAKTYEHSARDRVLSEALPGFAGTHETAYSEDVVEGGTPFPHYVWVDGTGITGYGQAGPYGPAGRYRFSEVLASIVTDADGRRKVTYTDHAGRTLATRTGVDSLTYYIYDSLDQLRAVVGGGIALSDTLSMWRYSYDSLGRLRSKGIPGCVREFYAYDSEDRVISVTRGDYLKEIAYDALGRPVRAWLTEGALPRRILEEHSYTYDKETAARYAILSSDPSDTSCVAYAYRYDDRGRRDRTVTSYPDGDSLTETLSYDFAGDIVSTVSTYVHGGQSRTLSVSTTRDALGRPVSGTSGLKRGSSFNLANATSSYSYDALGRADGKTVSTLSGSHSLTTADTFTLQGWLSSRDVTLDSNRLFIETLGYNDTDLIQGISPSYTGLVTSRTTRWTQAFLLPDLYAYDASGRLIKEIASPSSYEFAYDSRGNITSESVATLGGTTVTASTYSGDQLLTRGGATFTHDSHGRMTHDGQAGLDISYNAIDLPKTIGAAGGTSVSFRYSADGAKLGERLGDGSGLEYRGPFVYRRAADGTLTLESAVCPEGRLTASGTMLYATDYLGSVRAVINGNNGTVYEKSNYSSYGSRIVKSSITPPAGITLRDHYTGCEDLSPDFSLPYADHAARFYAPAIHRWMVPDPKSEEYYGGSVYAYCGGSPMNILDPWGMDLYYFDSEGHFVRKREQDGLDIIAMLNQVLSDSDGESYSIFFFADPINDPQDVDNGKITDLIFVDSATITEILNVSGTFDSSISMIDFVKNSTSLSTAPDICFDYSSVLGGFYNSVVDEDPSKQYHEPKSPCLFIVNGSHVAHNYMNFGNFLWGMSGYIMGFSIPFLLAGAHANSLGLFGKQSNRDYNNYPPQWDSLDDQLSITLGAIYARSHNLRKQRKD